MNKKELTALWIVFAATPITLVLIGVGILDARNEWVAGILAVLVVAFLVSISIIATYEFGKEENKDIWKW